MKALSDNPDEEIERLRRCLSDLERRVAERAAEIDQTINAIPVMAWCNSPDGSNEFLNRPWHEYTGVSPEAAHGWGWKDTIHPDDLPELLVRYQEAIESGEAGETKARLRRFDGAYRWFLFRVNPLRDADGRIVKWYGTNTDIDDLKRYEEEMRRSEAFLAEAQRLSVTGSFAWTLDTDELTCSEQFNRIYRIRTEHPHRVLASSFADPP